MKHRRSAIGWKKGIKKKYKTTPGVLSWLVREILKFLNSRVREFLKILLLSHEKREENIFC
jgi:hypothetical protein